MTNLTKIKSSLENKNVVIANVVSRAAQRLSLAEKRILFAGIAKLGGVHKEVKISAQEFAETFGIDTSTAYRQLKTSVSSLMNKQLSFQTEDGKAKGVATILWVQGYRYFNKEGYIAFRFSEYITPYLFELEREFTRYKLKQACALRSLHSWRMMELFEQMLEKKDSQGWLNIPLDEFWHAMEITDSYKKTFGLLRTKVIEPAIKELVEKDGWVIDWSAVKVGRKVSLLKFKFERTPKYRLNSEIL